MKENHTEVLVVGAGPTGLLAAVLLSEAGVDVQIIDREAGTAARSYACALHSDTLRMFDRMGLAADLLACGRRIHTVAFHDGDQRRAEIKLAELGGDFPFLLVLPQSQLESILEQRLGKKKKLAVNWNHRLDAIERDEGTVVGLVEQLEGTATGYIVPHWETMVKDRYAVRAQYLVGADGHNSLVRHRLGIHSDRADGQQSFVAFEFSSASDVEDTVHIVLDENTTNVFWPMPDHECRWTFQLVHAQGPTEFPEKDRRAVPALRALNDQLRGGLRKLIGHRAPWFAAEVREIAWCKQVAFEQRLAAQFGEKRCWLAGDAAHQTGPVGMQSMNSGLREAAALAANLTQVLRGQAPPELMADYNREWRNQWEHLLGKSGGLQPRSRTDAWVCQRRARILPCLPAYGTDLKHLAAQLELDLEP